MMEYQVIDVNTLLGYIKINITYPDLPSEVLTLDIDSISASEHDTEAQIVSALNQIVQARYDEHFPKPKRFSPNLDKIKSKKFRL